MAGQWCILRRVCQTLKKQASSLHFDWPSMEESSIEMAK